MPDFINLILGMVGWSLAGFFLVTCIHLRRMLKEAVVLILESEWVEGCDPNRRTVQLNERKMSTRGFVAANRIISSAAVLRGRWLEKKLERARRQTCYRRR